MYLTKLSFPKAAVALKVTLEVTGEGPAPALNVTVPVSPQLA